MSDPILIPAEVIEASEAPPPPRNDWWLVMWWSPQGGWSIGPQKWISREGAERYIAQERGGWKRYFRIVAVPGEGK